MESKTSSGQGPVVNCCELGNKPSSSTESEGLPGHLRNCHFLCLVKLKTAVTINKDYQCRIFHLIPIGKSYHKWSFIRKHLIFVLIYVSVFSMKFIQFPSLSYSFTFLEHHHKKK
jgi:hypothetical protein